MILRLWDKFVSFFKNIFFILILLSGLIALIIPIFFPFEDYPGVNDKINEFLKSIGIALLSGGVFSALLKSFQFMGIFKQELTEAIYTPETLKKLSNFRDIWEKITKLIYDNKFPNISGQIHTAIFDTYLPIDTDFYFKNYFATIDLSLDPETGLIKFQETVKCKLVATSKDTVSYSYKTLIKNIKEKTLIELESLQINGKEYTNQNNFIHKPIIKAETLTLEYNLQLTGSLEYLIVRKINRRYADIHNISLKRYSQKQAMVSGFFEVKVYFDDSLDVKFLKDGTIDKFIDKEDRARSNVIWKIYKGLVLPKQGFILIFQKKKW